MGLDDKKAHRTPRRNLRGLVPRTRRQVQRGRRVWRFREWVIFATPFGVIILSGMGDGRHRRGVPSACRSHDAALGFDVTESDCRSDVLSPSAAPATPHTAGPAGSTDGLRSGAAATVRTDRVTQGNGGDHRCEYASGST